MFECFLISFRVLVWFQWWKELFFWREKKELQEVETIDLFLWLKSYLFGLLSATCLSFIGFFAKSAA